MAILGGVALLPVLLRVVCFIREMQSCMRNALVIYLRAANDIPRFTSLKWMSVCALKKLLAVAGGVANDCRARRCGTIHDACKARLK